jgi:hypothetical protein
MIRQVFSLKYTTAMVSTGHKTGFEGTDHGIEVAHTGDVATESSDWVDESSCTGQKESGKCGKTF